MPENVRAMVLKEPGKYELRSFPYPKPQKGAAVVKMIMSGICGTDKHSYKGRTPSTEERRMRFTYRIRLSRGMKMWASSKKSMKKERKTSSLTVKS